MRACIRMIPVLTFLLFAAVSWAGGRGEKAAAMNHLKGQKSPYLLQHVTNPVDWYPWGDEAFQKAKREQKPIFLSIGYSTCHWCHVMEAESFTNPQVAALMNETFVSVKVDREERPDLDEHYMTASQLLTGSGGWPLTVIMTPDGKPFYAGTYIPRETAFGRLGMLELIPKIQEIWKTRREDVLQSADSIAQEIGKAAQSSSAGFTVDAHAMKSAVHALGQGYDALYGGFGTAPKFPMSTVFPLLLRAWKREGNGEALGMVEKTLTALRNGGIYDQLGFGFHRYSTDAQWLVPHFEKMLYDQALLAMAYTAAWQATGKSTYRETAREILAYVQRDLDLPGGGFASAEDADSQGEEGKFYLWTSAEIETVLGRQQASEFRRQYGENILHRTPSDTTAPGELEAKLLAARGTRVRPLRDDKVLTDWNGLMIAGFARAGRAFDDAHMVRAAEGAARFLLERLQTRGGRLLHRYRDGESAIPGFADDYAFLSWGLLELYQATFDPRYLEQAVAVVKEFEDHFWDPETGGFFQTADNARDVVARRKSFSDGVIPSANSVGLMVLLTLNRITGDQSYELKAETLLRLFPASAASQPLAYSMFLAAADFSAGPSYEVVVAGNPRASDTREMLAALGKNFLPNTVVIQRPTDMATPPIERLAPFTAGQGMINGKATAYVCTNFACDLPTNDVAVMLAELKVK